MNSTGLKPNHRVLIVDDNPSIHADFQEILCPVDSTSAETRKLEAALFGEQEDASRPARIQFDLDSAFQGQEALAMVEQSLAQNRPYALAFVDVRMPPGWDGVETISRIWKVDPDLQIVVCTAYSDHTWEEMRAKVGQPDSLLILKKPFDNVEVQQMAHALTKKWFLNVQTRLQMSELQAANAELFSKAFYENPLPSAIQSFPDQRFVDFNQKFLDVVGCKREEMLGRTPAELFLWVKPDLAEQWYEAVNRNESVKEQEARLRTPSGLVRETRVSLSPLALDGQTHVLLLVQDVSERALLERQLRQAQKMEAVGQLAAGVAHDFNNILTIIQGHAGLLRRTVSTEGPSTKSLQEIANASDRAATLIRQLLMFSRKQVMQFRYLDLNDVLRSALEMLGIIIGEHRQIEFLPQQPLPTMRADRNMVDQIIMNLAVNARDAMPNGGKISISTSVEFVHRPSTPMDPEPRQGDYICLTFRDTGVGMDAQTLGRIFEPFFTTKAVGKGTGLGLSTVFGIVRQHQGWLEVESQPDQGTTFRIYFPASRQPPETIAPALDSAPCGGSETVLVVEDEDVLRELVLEVLTLQGYTVLEASSGPRAIQVWEQAHGSIDLLLTDMVMPGGMTGRQLAERLRTKSPSLKVIFTSGYSPGMAGKDASLLECPNFLPKPYSSARLAHFVRECLDAPAKLNGHHSPSPSEPALALSR